MTRLTSFAPGLWVAEGGAVSFFGFPYPTRMVVVRLANANLFIWSPIALDPALRDEVAALGKPAYLVSPNKLHHLFLDAWQAAWPDALLWAPPGLARKRPGLHFDASLPDSAAPWAGEIDQVCFAGSPFLTEIVFFHRASRTALFGDLIQHFSRDWFSGWRGLLARLDGIVAPEWGAPREWRFSFFNRRAARQALSHIKAWDAERVVIAHGGMARENGAAVIAGAFRWLD